MQILKSSSIELGDTGALKVQRVGINAVQFTILEGAKERASLVLTNEKALYIIKVLCHICNVAVHEKRDLG